MKRVDLVFPFLNEEMNLNNLYVKVNECIAGLNYEFRFVFVDDGSSDNSLNIIKELQQKDERVHYITFSRNFGHQTALRAGIDLSTADALISLDSDLQHPPELIKDMLENYEEGYSIVYTIRATKDVKLSLFKRTTSKVFYNFINFLSDTPIHAAASDFRLIDKHVIRVIQSMPEKHFFLRGLVNWTGFSQKGIDYEPNDRTQGETKYSLSKMLRLGLDGITSFSTKPLYLSALVGLFLAGLAFAYGIYAIGIIAFTDKGVPGWASIAATVVFIGGVQLIMIGIIGVYMAKIFEESKKRPNYIIHSTTINDSPLLNN